MKPKELLGGRRGPTTRRQLPETEVCRRIDRLLRHHGVSRRALSIACKEVVSVNTFNERLVSGTLPMECLPIIAEKLLTSVYFLLTGQLVDPSYYSTIPEGV